MDSSATETSYGGGDGGGAGGTREAAYFTHVTPKLRQGAPDSRRGAGASWSRLQGVKTR